ncbi:hypothetical protein Agabi119p4_6055 [Agaricus bisporus var. burnettii]|uniref:Uncharacterized protein n=1 Tax=Agaricus bisporus var. burnettii TaxID=192524 RepID=A0A8H7F148_AGABI|nr:hypothetical protein Agabi119p4_6055 [Agaricus bisporus var. burnettii]
MSVSVWVRLTVVPAKITGFCPDLTCPSPEPGVGIEQRAASVFNSALLQARVELIHHRETVCMWLLWFSMEDFETCQAHSTRPLSNGSSTPSESLTRS